jgi:hypothetical protein
MLRLSLRIFSLFVFFSMLAGSSPNMLTEDTRELVEKSHKLYLDMYITYAKNKMQLPVIDYASSETVMEVCFDLTSHLTTLFKEIFVMVASEFSENNVARSDEVLSLLFYGSLVTCSYNIKESQVEQYLAMSLEEKNDFLIEHVSIFQRNESTPLKLSEAAGSYLKKGLDHWSKSEQTQKPKSWTQTSEGPKHFFSSTLFPHLKGALVAISLTLLLALLFLGASKWLKRREPIPKKVVPVIKKKKL